MAQLGRALPWGGRGREFESRRSDQINISEIRVRRNANLFVMYKMVCRTSDTHQEEYIMVKTFAKSKVIAPNLPQELPLVHINTFHEEDYVKLCLIQDDTFADQNATNIAISQVLFKNVVFNDIHWPFTKITDTIFENCDLSNVDFSQCFMDRVRLTNCKLVGIDMTEAFLRNVVFDDCNAAYSVLRYSNCKKVNFHNSSFAEADLYSVSLIDVNFVHCNLDKVQFSGTKLAGIDLSTCEFYQLGLTADNLRGCIIAPEQAIALANILGVVIKE